MSLSKCASKVKPGPDFHEVFGYVRKAPGHEPHLRDDKSSFDLVGKSSAGEYLVRFRLLELSEIKLLTVDVRCVAFVESDALAMTRWLQEENKQVGLGCWWLDMDGEVAYRFETTLSGCGWERQILFALSVPPRAVRRMRQLLDELASKTFSKTVRLN